MKERLVGAIVLVAAAIVFVPMILSGPESPPKETVTRATDRDPASERDGQFASRIAPNATAPSAVDRSTAPASATKAAPAKRPVAAKSVPAPVASKTQTASASNAQTVTAAAAKKGASAAKPAPAVSKPAAAPSTQASRTAARAAAKPASPRWVVQLASFASVKNAEGLRSRLNKKGYRAYVETVSRNGARVTRVMVGPQPSKEKSKADLEGLYKETGLKGIVVRHGS